MSQSWFITGANRGIGFEIVKIAASQGYTVFAGARNPANASALNQLAAQYPDIHVVKLASGSASDAEAAATVVEHTTGSLDVIIANAGIADNWQQITDVDIDSVREHFEVNTVGTLVLFQALYPLLVKGQTRKFVTISSNSASIGAIFPFPHTAYGASKAALNFITQAIHSEHKAEGFIAFPIHPGFVTTDMGIAGSKAFDTSFMVPLTPEQSAKAVFDKVDSATKEDSGRFWVYDGTELAW